MVCPDISTNTFRVGYYVENGKKVNDSNYSNTLISLFTQNTVIENFWKLESIGITDDCENKDRNERRKAVQVHFERNVKLNAEGRYEIQLPWIKENDILPDNKKATEKRKFSATRKFSTKNIELLLWPGNSPNLNIIEKLWLRL